MQHLDEGTIHAWLDGALPPDEAARTQQHASECSECAAAVAEARGLVAGSSRILSALDDVPAVTRSAGSRRMAAVQASRPPSAPVVGRRPVWSRPAVLAAAASVVLVAGTALVIRDGGYRAGSDVVSLSADSGTLSAQRTTEAAADAASREAPASRPMAAGNVSRDDKTSVASARAGAAQRRVAAATPSTPRSRRVLGATGRDTSRLRGGRLALSEIATTAAPEAADAAAAQKAPPMPLAPAPAPGAASARPGAPAVQLRGMTRRRADTTFRRRTDTLYGLQVDTIIASPPSLPTFRTRERMDVVRGALMPVSGVVYFAGCYDVIEGGVPSSIMLDTTRAEGGPGEARYVAGAPGFDGSWALKGNSGIQLSIAGTAVEARFDPATGSLRGTARRGGTTEAFVARRCR